MRSLTTLTVCACLLVVGSVGQAQDASGRLRVIVAPLKTSGGVDQDFGKDVTKKVRKQMEDFDLLVPLSEDEIHKALDRFKLDEEQMDLVSWRQVASRLNANLIIYGTAAGESSSKSVELDVEFVDAQRGEQMKIPEFSIEGTNSDEAAQHITTALDKEVKFLVALANCKDYQAGGDYVDAARNCDTALQLNPQSTRAGYLRSRVAVHLRNWNEAEKYLRPVVKADPENEDAVQLLALAELNLGNHEEALKLYQQYLHFNPDDQRTRLIVAHNLASAGADSDAIIVVREGLVRDSVSEPLKQYLRQLATREASRSGAADTTGGQHLRWTGTGDKSTQPFTMQRTGWHIVWRVEGDSMSSIAIFVKNAQTGKTITSASSNGPGGDVTYVYATGTFYLEVVSANATWTVQVEDGK